MEYRSHRRHAGETDNGRREPIAAEVSQHGAFAIAKESLQMCTVKLCPNHAIPCREQPQCRGRIAVEFKLLVDPR
jgi:hypothetical protein